MERAKYMRFNETHTLPRKNGYMDPLIKETTGIQLHPNNFNRVGGFILSRA
jgi:hypothetical protein